MKIVIEYDVIWFSTINLPVKYQYVFEWEEKKLTIDLSCANIELVLKIKYNDLFGFLTL